MQQKIVVCTCRVEVEWTGVYAIIFEENTCGTEVISMFLQLSSKLTWTYFGILCFSTHDLWSSFNRYLIQLKLLLLLLLLFVLSKIIRTRGSQGWAYVLRRVKKLTINERYLSLSFFPPLRVEAAREEFEVFDWAA